MMKKALLLTMFVFAVLMASAQTSVDTTGVVRHRPKVGVVLCGGGAKGFSQIRILKMIDEAGVPVDFIGGTSIGSIVGALYAVGYDPDDMEEMVRKQDWNQIIYDRFPISYAPVENKMQDRQYLATFPVSDGKIKVKSSLVDGVCVNLLLSQLMLPASNTKNFDELPVPYFCIATDVENACQYEINHGNLARSVRASMSIPFLFKPVVIDGKVLVDGGMVNNFPVRNMKEHGADIIIAIDVEDDVIPASQLDSSVGLLESMMKLASRAESDYAHENCDIYIRPDLHGRNMMSFNDYDSILQFGEDAARRFYPQLKHLADSLYAIEPFEINRPHVKPVATIKVTNVMVDGISEDHDDAVVREFSTDFPVEMSVEHIRQVILKLSASGYYEDLWYEMRETYDGAVIILHGKEREDKSVSFSIHYDNNYGIGTLVNFTMKNLWNSMNRTTMSFDFNIAENPYVRMSVNKRQGGYMRYGLDLSVVSLKINQHYDAKIHNSYNIQSNNLNVYAQFIPTLRQQLRLGAVVDYVRMKDNIIIRAADEKKYSFYSYLYLNYFYGNEDDIKFSKRGWRISLLGKCLFFEGIENDGTIDRVGNQVVYTVQENIEKAFMLGQKNSLKFGLQGGAKIGDAEVPQFYKFLVGGQSRMKYFNNIVAFTGLNFVDKIVDYVAIGKVAWQWNFYKFLYSTVSFDCGYMSSGYDDWFESKSFVAGAGVSLGANTVIGPVILSLMGSNINSSAVGFINVGYWF